MPGDASKLVAQVFNHGFTNIGDYHVETNSRPDRIHAPNEKRNRARSIGIDIASDHASRAKQLRGDRQYPRTAAHVEHRVPRFYDPLHRLQAKLSAGMLAGAALQPGIELQPKTSSGSRVVTPRRDHKEFFADQNRRPRVVSLLDPIGIGTLYRIAELRCRFEIVEKSFQPTIVFNDASSAGFIKNRPGDRGRPRQKTSALNAFFFARPEFFLEHHFANFTGAGLRQLVRKLDDPRQLEFAQPL